MRKAKRDKKLYLIPGIPISMVVSLFIWTKMSSVPNAFLIKYVFDKDATTVGKEQLKSLTEDLAVTIQSDLPYRKEGKNSTFDIYIPNKVIGTNRQLPLLIWTHGGAWVSGDKAQMTGYYQKIANQGFVVASLNYDLAPQEKYPYQVFQINDAHQYLIKHAKEFHIHPEKIILMGSSAGAQLSAQFATIITNSAYAQKIGIDPALKPNQLKGTVLYSGIYNMQKLASSQAISSKLIRWGFSTAAWAYSGEKGHTNDNLFQASPIHYVNEKFPPTFISGGNGDSLTKLQSIPFSEKLQDLDVDVTSRFYPDDHDPILKHENQYVFSEDGQALFQEMIDFLTIYTKNKSRINIKNS